ncbi:hypothetical protein Rsub_12663 [Raphidocelis subcapitata]|uniref:Terpene synthase n=1 Tax=Raphidocelis subcapitata TaxID=307507 RepID=A0A2V0PPJ8_9CHLO|nr:hypothetical protein Rsub_12663 [Raphidocelis subcapitata]|eukprot:GBF99970.1 hypothetical protein Rsub_12663 [Raphidocelis subcapitata]
MATVVRAVCARAPGQAAAPARRRAAWPHSPAPSVPAAAAGGLRARPRPSSTAAAAAPRRAAAPPAAGERERERAPPAASASASASAGLATDEAQVGAPPLGAAATLDEARASLDEGAPYAYCAAGAFAGDAAAQRARRDGALTAALRAWLDEGGYEAAGLPVGKLLEIVNPATIVLETNPGSAARPRLQLAMSMWVLWFCLADDVMERAAMGGKAGLARKLLGAFAALTHAQRLAGGAAVAIAAAAIDAAAALLRVPPVVRAVVRVYADTLRELDSAASAAFGASHRAWLAGWWRRFSGDSLALLGKVDQELALMAAGEAPGLEEYMNIRVHTGGGLCYLDLLELGLEPGLLDAAAGGPAAAASASAPAAERFGAAAFAAATAVAGPSPATAMAAGGAPGSAAAAVAGAGAADRLAAVRYLIAGAIGLQNDIMSVEKDAADGAFNAAVFAQRALAAEAAAAAGDGASAAVPLRAAVDAVVGAADRCVAAAAALAAPAAAAGAAEAAALAAYHAAGARLAKAIVGVMLGAARRRYGDASVGSAVPARWRLP